MTADEQIGAADKAFMATVTPVGFVGDVVVITAPDEFVKTVMERRLRPVLVAHLSAIYERQIEVAFFTATAPAEAKTPADSDDASSLRLRVHQPSLHQAAHRLVELSFGSPAIPPSVHHGCRSRSSWGFHATFSYLLHLPSRRSRTRVEMSHA